MKYESTKDQAKHKAMAKAIDRERKLIAQHYRIIQQLQERILEIGTKDEQITKRMNLRSLVQFQDA